jgi:archaellum biogenesis ATPase FlaH
MGRRINNSYSESGFQSAGHNENINKNIITAKEMIENNITEIPMLWNPFLPKQGLALLSGESDTGKSTLMRQFSSAIVSGQDTFLGLELRADLHSTIYVCTEDDITSISARLKMEFDSANSTDPFLNLRYIFSEENVVKQLDDELEQRPADCVIIDALGDIFEGDGNSMTSVRQFYKPYDKLSKRYGCLILFVHHNRKSSGKNPAKTDISGSQAFEAKPRAVLMLRNGTGSTSNKELSIVKGNFIPSELKNTDLSLRINDDGVFELLDVTSPKKGISKTNHNENYDVNRIFELRNEGKSIRKTAEILKDEGIILSKTKVGKISKDKENDFMSV